MFHLLPYDVLRGVAGVLTFGFKKYGKEGGWKEVPGGLNRYRSAQERHFTSWSIDGEELDSESGLRHAFHYACNALFIAWFMIHADRAGNS